jgi:spoIIIJ-associated protein
MVQDEEDEDLSRQPNSSEIPGAPAHPTAGAEDDYELQVASDTVRELLEKMKVTARVTAHFGEADDKDNRIPLHVDVHGDDLSILIGRRAETLNALQYIASLIVSKELGHSIPLIIDVEGYRSRRENQLRQLARRMAEQAIKTNRRQVLEPMPASERRIVHIELRNHPEVTTESIGEEPRRKVTIIPKE